MLKRLGLALSFAVALSVPAFAENLSLITGPQDPSQLNATINSVIQSINAQNFVAGITTTPNGTVVTTLTNGIGQGPTGSSTAIQEWLVFRNSSGALRFVPAW